MKNFSDLPQWIGYITKPKFDKNGNQIFKPNGKLKLDKIPKNPKTGGNAQTNNPSTWATYETAVSAMKKYKFDGVGFVFTKEAGIVGIDLDDCVLEDGTLNSYAQGIINQLNSYTEFSPSGDGVHVLTGGTIPYAVKNGRIEIYAHGRFFTYTDERVPNTNPEICYRQQELDQLIAVETAVQKELVTLPAKPVESLNMDDEELISMAKNAKNGNKFSALWHGDTNGYESHSEADLALCNMLAYWTRGDETAVNRLFHKSGLMREKWNERHYADGSTYGQVTIKKSLSNLNTHYEPSVKTLHDDLPKTAVNPLHYRCEDGGILDAWLDRYGKDWIFIPRFGFWYSWVGTHWQKDEDYEIKQTILDLLDEMNKEARRLLKYEQER